MWRFNSAPEGSAAPLTPAASGQSPRAPAFACGAACAAVAELPALPTPQERGFPFLRSTQVHSKCTARTPRQSAAVSAVCLPWANALKATCGHDPAAASCAVGCGSHVFLTCVSVGSGWFFPLVLVSLGMHPAGLSMCLWSHSVVSFCFLDIFLFFPPRFRFLGI